MAIPAMGRVQLEQLLAMIVLLQLLNDTTQLPSDNFIEGSSVQNDENSNRVLSLKREKKLAETFAFLAAYTDDPGKVIALCIEEVKHGKGMIIRLAVNNGDLEMLQQGFQKVAGILEKVANRGSPPTELDEADLLREIISINHNRILCRLRSRHATLKCNFKKEKLQRPQPIPQLQAIVAGIPATRVPTIAFAALEAMGKNEALSQFGLNLLIEILVAARRLKSKDLLEPILNRSTLAPAGRMLMTRLIVKLARYSTASDFLIRAARDLSAFTDIQVLVAKLPPTPLRPISDPASLQSSIIDSIFDPNQAENGATDLHARLRKKYRRSLGLENIVAEITITKFVVHAEIQLLIYHELNPSSIPPRVICSSKKACFLCNLFLRLHGKFVTPSTHGRLYEKWTFPDGMKGLPEARANEMRVVIEKFSEAVTTELRREILHARRPYPAPHESIMFASAVWTPPIQSRSRLNSSLIVRVDSLQKAADTHISPYPGSNEAARDSGIVLPSITDDKNAIVDKTTHCQVLIETHPTGYLPLARGEPLTLDMPLDGEDLKVGTPRIHLALSYEAGNESEDSRTDLPWQVLVRWLQMSDATQLKGDETILDLKKFPKGSEITLNRLARDSCFYVACGSDIIMIQRSDKTLST